MTKTRNVGTAQRRIVDTLKRLAPAVTADLAATLNVTTAAIRPQLSELESRGLVKQEQLPANGRGRPSAAWSLSDLAIELFPDRHDDLTIELIQSIREALGDKGLEKVLSVRDQHLLAEFNDALPIDADLATRVKTMAKVRTRQGYMAEVKKENQSLLLIEHHCPVCAAAQQCQGLCRNELAMFKSFIGDSATVEREQHLLSGDERCVYRIVPVN